MSQEKKTLSLRAERRRSEQAELAQVLLNRPWVQKSEDPALFLKIKEHYEPLRQWFQHLCGFTLLETREVIKLEKIPGAAQSWMGFAEFSNVMDYGLFTYCLWYLENKGEMEQFALSELVEDVKGKLRQENHHFDEGDYPHRLSLKRALRKLRELGALKAVDGDEEDWVHHHKDERKNVLYECTPVTRYVLRRFSQDISQATKIEQLGEGVYPDSQEGEITKRRHHIFRRLVQEPAVLDNQWQDDERQYVLFQRTYIINQFQIIGLEGSRYKEGLLFYYPHPKGEMTLFPTAQSFSDLVQLLAEQIRREQQNPLDGDWLVTRTDLETWLTKMKVSYQSFWSKKDKEAKIGDLAEELLQHMEEWGLARRIDQQRFYITPVLGRWSGFYRAKEEEAT